MDALPNGLFSVCRRFFFLSTSQTRTVHGYELKVFLVLFASTSVYAQSTASIEGQVTDGHGGSVAGAEITAISSAISLNRKVIADGVGRYLIAALPVGAYRIEVRARGFQTQILESIRVDVGRRVTQNLRLQVGDISEQVTPCENTIYHRGRPQMTRRGSMVTTGRDNALKTCAIHNRQSPSVYESHLL